MAKSESNFSIKGLLAVLMILSWSDAVSADSVRTSRSNFDPFYAMWVSATIAGPCILFTVLIVLAITTAIVRHYERTRTAVLQPVLGLVNVAPQNSILEDSGPRGMATYKGSPSSAVRFESVQSEHVYYNKGFDADANVLRLAPKNSGLEISVL